MTLAAMNPHHAWSFENSFVHYPARVCNFFSVHHVMDLSLIILLVTIALTLFYLTFNFMRDTYDPLGYPTPRPNYRNCQTIQSKLQRVRQQLKILELQEGQCAATVDPAAVPEDVGVYIGKSLVEVRPLLKEKYPTKTIEERREGMLYATLVKSDTILVYYKQLEIPANVSAVPGTFTEVTRVVIQPTLDPAALPPSALPALPPTVRPIHWNGGRPNMPFAVRPIMSGEKTNWMPRRGGRGGRRGRRNGYQVTNWM